MGGTAVAGDLADRRAAMQRHAAIGQPCPHAAVDQLLQREPRQPERIGRAGGQQPGDESFRAAPIAARSGVSLRALSR